MSFKKSKNHVSKKPQFNLHRFNWTFLVGALLIILIATLACQPSAKAQIPADLASKYAPVLHFTSGEKFYPTTVNYIIESSSLKQRATSGSPSLIDAAPTPETLGTYTADNLYLDNKLGTFENIEADYAANAASSEYTAYVHILTSYSFTSIQYWLFYAYNNGPLNDHQGDIEVIEVFLDTNWNPQTVLLSQHGAGQNAAWGDVEKDGNHPVVYVAEGSHANYFRSYQGKMGIESDIVGNDGKTIQPTDLNCILLGTESWLDFPGRWGYWGTDVEVALGRAGPYGPVFNQNGIRWDDPQAYLASTYTVDGNYLILAWLVSSFLLFFVVYIVAYSAWKGWRIFRLSRRSGLRVGRFLKGRGGIGFILGIIAIIVGAIALFVPWYTISASSQVGPLANQGDITLMSIDGVRGVNVNMFLGTSNSDASSGYITLFSTQLPFAIILGAGIIFLVLDVIGVTSGKSMARKLWFGCITTILPIILILVFISQLPALIPFASGLFPGQSVPPQVTNMLYTIAGSPIAGTTSSTLPVVGVTTVNWGIALGVYLFIVAIALRIVGGFLMYTTPDLQATPTVKAEKQPLPPPPPIS